MDFLTQLSSAKQQRSPIINNQKQYINTLLDHLLDVVVIFKDSLQIVYANESFLSLFRVRSKTLAVGKSIDDFLVKESALQIHKYVLKKRVRVSLPMEFIGNINGDQIYTKGVILPLQGAKLWALIGRNITGMKRLEKRCEELTFFANLNPTVLVQVSRYGDIVSANREAIRVLNLKKGVIRKIDYYLSKFNLINLPKIILNNSTNVFYQNISGSIYKIIIKGIRHLNTAHIYGFNATEEILSRKKMQRYKSSYFLMKWLLKNNNALNIFYKEVISKDNLSDSDKQKIEQHLSVAKRIFKRAFNDKNMSINSVGFLSNKSVGSLNVLIIEDDVSVAYTLKLMLQKLGHRSYIAYNLQEAISLYQQENFDVVFIDFSMPSCNGLEVLLALKEVDSNVKAILTTGNAFSKEKQNFYISQGFISYLQKPYSIKDLSNFLDNLSH